MLNPISKHPFLLFGYCSIVKAFNISWSDEQKGSLGGCSHAGVGSPAVAKKHKEAEGWLKQDRYNGARVPPSLLDRAHHPAARAPEERGAAIVCVLVLSEVGGMAARSVAGRGTQRRIHRKIRRVLGDAVRIYVRT